MEDRGHQLGTIVSASYHIDPDRNVPMVSVGLKFKGSYQDFGGMFESMEKAKSFLKGILSTFGIEERDLMKAIDQLVGKDCYALRAFADWGEMIEGLEAMNGNRFTKTAWRRKYYPDVATPLESTRQSLERDIEFHIRRAKEAKAQLKTLDARYLDWEKR